MRMAEARYIEDRTGEQALLLLMRRFETWTRNAARVFSTFVQRHPQVVLTGTTPTAFPDEFRADRSCFMLSPAR